LHQRQKSGFLRLLQPENLDYSLINPVFQVLLRMVQDVSLSPTRPHPQQMEETQLAEIPQP
jgi:hypothetical protein